MKKLYFAAMLAIATQVTLPKNNHYPLIGRSEDNEVKTNCENLNPAFLGIWKNDEEKACDSIEKRLEIVAREMGYATQGFAFSYLPDYKKELKSGFGHITRNDRYDYKKTIQQIVNATNENLQNIETIIGRVTVFINPQSKYMAAIELEALAEQLCHERKQASKLN
jgi:hypothetical protein